MTQQSNDYQRHIIHVNQYLTLCQNHDDKCLMNVIQSRKERERAARESLILKHGARLVARDGFQDLNLDELAAAAEYSKGTLYLHFKTKEDLVLAVATRALQHRADLLERAAAFSGKTRERVRAMAFASCEFMVTHRDFFAVELILQARSFWDRASEERRSRHLAESGRIFRLVNQVVEDARACGDLSGGYVARTGDAQPDGHNHGLPLHGHAAGVAGRHYRPNSSPPAECRAIDGRLGLGTDFERKPQ